MISKEKSPKNVYSPRMCLTRDYDKREFILDIILPGIEKKDIRLEINKRLIYVLGESDSVKYIGRYRLYRPIIPVKTKVDYNNGLLRIKAPIQDISIEMMSTTLH